MVPPCTYLLPSWQRRRFRLPCALRRCSSRRPLKVHVYRSACDVWVNDSSRLFKRSSATANSAAPWCRHARTLSWQRRRFRLPCILRRCSSQRPFIFLGSRVMSDVPIILRGLFEVSSATANSAAPWCRHAHICCRRGNGDAFDCRALCDAALHDGLSVLLPAPTVRGDTCPNCRATSDSTTAFQTSRIRVLVSNVCVGSPTPVLLLPLPAPTFAPLQVPTAGLLLAPTVVPMPAPTAVPLPA